MVRNVLSDRISLYIHNFCKGVMGVDWFAGSRAQGISIFRNSRSRTRLNCENKRIEECFAFGVARIQTGSHNIATRVTKDALTQL